MKRMIRTSIAFALAGTIFLGGCSAPSEESVSATQGDSTDSSSEVPTLNFWSMREDSVEDYQTNAYITWLEQEQNVNIEFEQISSAEALQKFNVSLASGTYPDVYFGCQQVQGMNSTIMNSALIQYGEAGIFLPLNDLIEEHGENTKQLLADVPYAEGVITMPDGNIYALPTYSEIYHVRYSLKLFMDQTWLDNLSLEMPETTEDFYNVLKAFKEQDANGNGDPNDEIPLSGATNAWHSDPSNFLMNAFIYDDEYTRLTFDDGGDIISIYNQDAYREGLRYINKLYEEGLIFSETFAQNQDQIKTQTSGSPNSVGSAPGGSALQVASADSEFYSNTVTVPPLIGPDGTQQAAYYGYNDLRPGAYIITNACEDPELAFKIGDFMYSEESSMRMRQGEFGVDWDVAEEGQKTFDGNDALYTRITPLVTGDGVQNQHMGNTGLWRETNDLFIGSWSVADDFDIRSLAGIEQLLIEQTWPYDGLEPEKTVPPIVFTDEENTALADIMVEVNNYAKQQRVLFITGEVDIETEWDTYISELDNLGINTMVEYYNTAYDRMQ